MPEAKSQKGAVEIQNGLHLSDGPGLTNNYQIGDEIKGLWSVAGCVRVLKEICFRLRGEIWEDVAITAQKTLCFDWGRMSTSQKGMTCTWCRSFVVTVGATPNASSLLLLVNAAGTVASR
jgi:hypothetical protein